MSWRDKYKNMNHTWIKFEKEGDHFTGTFVDVIEKEINGELQDVPVFTDDAGKECELPSNVGLLSLLVDIPAGKKLTLTYIGKARTKSGGSFKKYEMALAAPLEPSV